MATKNDIELDLRSGEWLFEPSQSLIDSNSISITTSPQTDYWQGTYYGFRIHNAPAYLFEVADNFTFTAKVEFTYKTQFDQCGLIIVLDERNWFKASIEYENTEFARLGSVVTNMGYSDWATTDISLPKHIYYRLHRRGPDFLLESSYHGLVYKQMRVFHLHALGETTAEMGKLDPPQAPEQPIKMGVYACSPGQSSFAAKFSDITLTKCLWKSHN